jgi:hypothetical protein
MKSYWIVAAAVFLAWPSSSKAYVGSAQNANEPSSAPAQTEPQSKSPSLLVELSKTLKAKKLKPGDKIKAEVVQDVVSHGKVIIPVETQVIGHVTEVSVRDGGNPESRLGIVFDRILLKHYHDVNIRAVVQAVQPPVMRRSRVDEPSQMLPPSMMVGMRPASSVVPGRSSGPTATRTVSAPPSTAMSESNSGVTMQAPLTVKQSPSTHTETGSSAAQLGGKGKGGTSMSVGTPLGVTGIKGLSLASPTASTPGPVMVSKSENIKLESGTQVLLRVLSVETPQPAVK